jgi:hypothetical protein
MRNDNQPFGTIESTEQYLALLSQRIDEVFDEARGELSKCKFDHDRTETWQLVLYTIKKLSSHIATSRKLMTDLDALRSVLNSNTSAPADAHVQCA